VRRFVILNPEPACFPHGNSPRHRFCFFQNRLLDIVHADNKLYLVFEFLDVDLKRYMDTLGKAHTPISMSTAKVSIRFVRNQLLVSVTSWHHASFPCLSRVPLISPRSGFTPLAAESALPKSLFGPCFHHLLRRRGFFSDFSFVSSGITCESCHRVIAKYRLRGAPVPNFPCPQLSFAD
jgi:hypothetical protein